MFTKLTKHTKEQALQFGGVFFVLLLTFWIARKQQGPNVYRATSSKTAQQNAKKANSVSTTQAQKALQTRVKDKKITSNDTKNVQKAVNNVTKKVNQEGTKLPKEQKKILTNSAAQGYAAGKGYLKGTKGESFKSKLTSEQNKYAKSIINKTVGKMDNLTASQKKAYGMDALKYINNNKTLQGTKTLNGDTKQVINTLAKGFKAGLQQGVKSPGNNFVSTGGTKINNSWVNITKPFSGNSFVSTTPSSLNFVRPGTNFVTINPGSTLPTNFISTVSGGSIIAPAMPTTFTGTNFISTVSSINPNIPRPVNFVSTVNSLGRPVNFINPIGVNGTNYVIGQSVPTNMVATTAVPAQAMSYITNQLKNKPPGSVSPEFAAASANAIYQYAGNNSTKGSAAAHALLMATGDLKWKQSSTLNSSLYNSVNQMLTQNGITNAQQWAGPLTSYLQSKNYSSQQQLSDAMQGAVYGVMMSRNFTTPNWQNQ